MIAAIYAEKKYRTKRYRGRCQVCDQTNRAGEGMCIRTRMDFHRIGISTSMTA